MDKKEKAIELACEAYSQLCEAGISEEFVPMLVLIGQANRGAFFGSFGSDSGCFIEFQHVDNVYTPLKLIFGLRRYKQPFFLRLSNMLREGWAIFRGHDTEHEIYLKSDDITRLKDLLRVLK